MALDITFLGHAGFLLSDGTHTLAIDPFLTGNPEAAQTPDAITCQTIALTHAHADHFGDTIAIAKANNATVIAAFEICEHLLSKHGVTGNPGNPGGQIETEFGFVAFTQAFHSSSYEGAYMGMPCGLIVNMGGVTVYHCGDTGLFSDMKLIGELYRPDVAMIPIGDRFTMGPRHATMAAEWIQPRIAIPIHFNTWPPIEQDPATFAPHDVAVRVMNTGEQITVEASPAG